MGVVLPQENARDLTSYQKKYTAFLRFRAPIELIAFQPIVIRSSWTFYIAEKDCLYITNRNRSLVRYHDQQKNLVFLRTYVLFPII